MSSVKSVVGPLNSDADYWLQLIRLPTAAGLSWPQTVVSARKQSLADISDVALRKRLRTREPWLRSLTAKMTDLDETGVSQCLSPGRRLRAVNATTGEEQGGAGTDWRGHNTLRWPDLSCDFLN